MTSYYKKNIEIFRDEEEDRLSRMKLDRWIFRLLLVVIGLMPLIILGYEKEVIAPDITSIDLLLPGLKSDLYTHYKFVVLFIITITATILFLAKIIFVGGEVKKTKLNIFLSIFIIGILLSTLFTPTKSIALWGQYNRADGAITYLCYMALFFIAMNITYPKKTLNYIVYAFYPFIITNFVLMTLNFTGNDAFQFPLVQKILLLFMEDGKSIDEGTILLGTINQWNFMSGMFTIMTAMYLSWAIIDENKVRSIINSFVAIIAFAIMLMSISTSGFLTAALIVPLLIVLAVKSGNLKQAVIVGSVFIIVTLPVFHVLAKENPRVWDESIGFIIKKNPYIKEQPTASVPTDYEFSLENRAYAADSEFELPVLPERGVAAGSGRAYIWEKTLKMTMDRPLLGYGMDTIMYHFPHYNIDARAGMWSETTIVDKPHNMYIGVLYGTGIIGFIGFMGIIIITALSAFKVIVAKKQVFVTSVFAAGWLAFLIQALFNDSLPGTAGPMWGVAGMMMALMIGNKEVGEITDGRND